EWATRTSTPTRRESFRRMRVEPLGTGLPHATTEPGQAQEQPEIGFACFVYRPALKYALGVRSFVQERRLLGYLAKHRQSFLLGFVCVVVTNVLTLTGPWLLKYAIDDLQSSLTLDKVRVYAAALLGLALAGGF